MIYQLNVKIVVLSILLLFNVLSRAQVNMEFTSVNEYSFSTKEALNLIATNGNTKAFNVVFNGNIKDANGNLVVEFKTHEATLNIGANIFTPQNLSLAEVNYSNKDIAEIESASGSYPSGNYYLCIWLVCATSDCNGLGSIYTNMEPKCINLHIENPTPLILATPENESEIEETRPLYTWIPPSSVAGSANLNYTIILVEILDGQSKADALTLNRPLIEMEGLGNPALMHPSDIPELEKGKWYAWQVAAFVGKTPFSKSEQWKFKVKKKDEKQIYRYFDLNSINTEIPKVKLNDKLFFTIQNQLGIPEPKFKIGILNQLKSDFDLERVEKDSIEVNSEIYTKDLSKEGIAKYFFTVTPNKFIAYKVYELSIFFNNQQTIFKFEITE